MKVKEHSKGPACGRCLGVRVGALQKSQRLANNFLVMIARHVLERIVGKFDCLHRLRHVDYHARAVGLRAKR